MKLRKLSIGIYEDQYGIRVLVPSGSRDVSPHEHRFPKGSSIDRLIAWRATQVRQRGELAPVRRRDTLTRDVVRYLKRLKGRACYQSEKAHLRAWLHLFGDKPRRALTRDQVEFALASWRQQGYARRTLRHRYRVLESLYRYFDGGKWALTPLDEVTRPAQPKPNPIPVPDTIIRDVALELRKHEVCGQLRDSKTRARFLIRATCPQRPCQIKWTEKGDVDLTKRTWAVRSAKGGPGILLPLNDQQLAAWSLFIAADAFGPYDSTSFCKVLHRCGWPRGIDPYNMRHSIATALDAQQVSEADIQTMFQHTSPTTTRHYYKPGQRARLAEATAALEGRFDATPFVATPPRLRKKTKTEPAVTKQSA